MENDKSPTSENSSLPSSNALVLDKFETRKNEKYHPIKGFQKNKKIPDFFGYCSSRLKNFTQEKQNDFSAIKVSRIQTENTKNKDNNAKLHTKNKNKLNKQINIWNKKLNYLVHFILNFQSTQISDQISFFDKVMLNNHLWEDTNKSIDDSENLELQIKFRTSIDLLKKSNCFKFVKQLILGNEDKNKNEKNEHYSKDNELTIMKKKCLFLKFFKNLNFLNKNLIHYVSSLSFISERKKLTLCRFLFDGTSFNDFVSNLQTKSTDPLLNFIQSKSFELIFGIRQKANTSFLKNVFFKSDSNDSSFYSEGELSIYDADQDASPIEEVFETNLSKADQVISSSNFLTLLNQLQKSSDFEKNLKAEPFYGLFKNGHILLPHMRYWFLLKAKVEFFKNEFTKAKNLLDLEMKRKLTLAQRTHKERTEHKLGKDLILRKRDHQSLSLVSDDKGFNNLKNKVS